MSKYVVVTWPDSQNLMDREGFRENSYLVNDDKGIEDFGSSAYFVDEDWLAEATGTMTDEPKTRYCEQTYLFIKACEDNLAKQEFDNPFNLSEDRIAIGFYLDEDNETIMVITCKSEEIAEKHLAQIEEDGDEVEELNFFAMPLEDRDDVARYIEDSDYTSV